MAHSDPCGASKSSCPAPSPSASLAQEQKDQRGGVAFLHREVFFSRRCLCIRNHSLQTTFSPRSPACFEGDSSCRRRSPKGVLPFPCFPPFPQDFLPARMELVARPSALRKIRNTFGSNPSSESDRTCDHGTSHSASS